MSENLIHQYFKPIESGNDKIDYIINNLVVPEIWFFCEIQVHYEVGSKLRDGCLKKQNSRHNYAVSISLDMFSHTA